MKNIIRDLLEAVIVWLLVLLMTISNKSVTFIA